MEEQLIKITKQAIECLKELKDLQDEMINLVKTDETMEELFQTSPQLKELSEEFYRYAEQINL